MSDFVIWDPFEGKSRRLVPGKNVYFRVLDHSLLLDVVGVLYSLPTTYISGTGTEGVDNVAATLVTVVVAANTLTQVGDRIRVRAYWIGNTGSPITGSTKLGPPSSEILIGHTTDIGTASFQVCESWLHYIDNTHANIIEMENGALGSVSSANTLGFAWNAVQNVIFTQNKISDNHCIVYAVIVDVFPKGL